MISLTVPRAGTLQCELSALEMKQTCGAGTRDWAETESLGKLAMVWKDSATECIMVLVGIGHHDPQAPCCVFSPNPDLGPLTFTALT